MKWIVFQPNVFFAIFRFHTFLGVMETQRWCINKLKQCTPPLVEMSNQGHNYTTAFQVKTCWYLHFCLRKWRPFTQKHEKQCWYHARPLVGAIVFCNETTCCREQSTNGGRRFSSGSMQLEVFNCSTLRWFTSASCEKLFLAPDLPTPDSN